MPKLETTHLATRCEAIHKPALEAAAKKCGIPFATGLRVVALAATGISPLEDQLTKATTAGLLAEKRTNGVCICTENITPIGRQCEFIVHPDCPQHGEP